MVQKYKSFRQKYKTFIYNGYTVTEDDNKIDITSTNELQLHFDAATGKIKEVKVGPTSYATTSGIGNIYITRNDYDIKLKVFFNTGKCERE